MRSSSFTFVLILIMTLSCVKAGAQQDNCSCCSESYRQFDFWVGDWVTLSDGDTVGMNSIVTLQDSCVLQENWVSASPGYTGTSYNYYDPQDGKWHQTWIDNQGQSLRLSGTRKDNQMILKSTKMKDNEGNSVYHRITWTSNEDGTVRQLWESSPAGKAPWKIIFDGLYFPKN